MSDKTYVFDSGASGVSSMLPALLQNRGIDPSAVMGMINGNKGGLLGNNGLGDIIALIIVAAIFGNGNGGGFLGGGGNNSANAEREMLMQALQRNGVDISQLAQSVNCSSSQILQGINAVANSICGLGNQMGQNTNQILTAMLQGNNALTSQLASCCCDIKTIMSQGFSSIGYQTERQTCSIEKAIAASTAQIVEGQRAAEMREMNREISERDRRIAEQATAINNYQQTQTFGAMLQPLNAAIVALQGDIDGIKCKMPPTTVVPNPQVTALPTCVAAQYGLYGVPFLNGNGSFF